jgi:signal transduction histidine kinase
MRGSSRVTWNEIEQLRRRVRELELTRERLSRLYFSQVEAGKTRMEKLHRLLEVVTQLNSTLDLESLLDGIVRAVQATLGFRVVLLRVLDPERRDLRARAFAGLSVEAVARLECEHVPLDTFLSWLSDEFRVGRSYFISHTHAFSHHLPEGVRSQLGAREPWEWHEEDVLFVPLYAKSGEIVGYLSVDDPVDRLVPSRETIELLEVFANHVVVALENARLYHALEEHSQRLEEANARLGELTRLKSNFLSAISHELRTPLTSIRAYVDTLRDASPTVASGDSEAWRHSLEILGEESQRLESLIDSVLSFSALESGAGPQTAEVALGELARECGARLTPAARAKGVTLELDVPASEIHLLGDRELLMQMILQLGGNAVKFTPKGGRVTIALGGDEKCVRLAVADTGIGIPPQEIGRIFERFYQIDGGLSRRFGGTGLGLAICKSVAEWHGGHIGVQSRLGQGSCFTVELPLEAPVQAQAWLGGERRRDGAEQALGLAMEFAAEVLKAPRVALLAHQSEGDLVPRATVGMDLEEMRSLRLRPGEGIAGHALAVGGAVESDDAESDPRFLGHRREPYRSGQVLAAPVRVGERIAAVLVVGTDPENAGMLDARARGELLGLVADRLGSILARVERQRRGDAEVQVVADTLRSVLVHLRRDRRGAPDRVRYAARVARALGLDDREAAQVAFAALVQDIALSRPEAAAGEGPVSSEAEAMQRIACAPPGELAARLERELERRPGARETAIEAEDEVWLRRHPEAAVEILAPLECEGAVRLLVLAHHEWVNGAGWPRGLSGNQIPLGARVLAVVDTFESWVLGRVGRPAVAVEDAVAELRRLSGERFDGAVVEALIDVLAGEGRVDAPHTAGRKAA